MEAAAFVVAPAINWVAWPLIILSTLVAAFFPPTTNTTTTTINTRVRGIAR